MPNQLDQLKQYTTVVADTGEIEAISAYSPQDATTNPSLIFSAVQKPAYFPLLREAIDKTDSSVRINERLDAILERLLVLFGSKILEVIPGRVSTEVDARLSFDTKASIEQGRRIICLYEEAGCDRSRILIKLASTWEGIQAAKVLEAEGVHCNMTLLFSLEQAIACAEANATLISPFVGRILDWYKAKGQEFIKPDEDPGVISVKQIYDYYKAHGYKTQVMGASFRNIGEILELCGCDLLTISPSLMQQLQQSFEPISRKLGTLPPRVKSRPPAISESHFRFKLNDNVMACEKLAEGIRNFAKDTDKLIELVKSNL